MDIEEVVRIAREFGSAGTALYKEGILVAYFDLKSEVVPKSPSSSPPPALRSSSSFRQFLLSYPILKRENVRVSSQMRSELTEVLW